MKCPKCNKKAKASATRFIEYIHAQRRIRTCECGFKFTTYERIEEDKQESLSEKIDHDDTDNYLEDLFI